MTRRLDITAMLTDPATRVVVCTGAGGVGKTTTAAAVALSRNVVLADSAQ